MSPSPATPAPQDLTGVTLSARARGIAWIEGRLFLRVAIHAVEGAAHLADRAADLELAVVLVDSSSGRRIPAPTTTASRRVDGASTGERELQVETWLDPRSADAGGALPDGVWRIRVEAPGHGGSVDVSVSSDLPARGALLAGRPAIAAADAGGDLVIDATRAVDVIDAGRPRLDAASLTASTGSTRTVSASVPVDGLHVHGRGTVEGIVTAERDGIPPRRFAGVLRRLRPVRDAGEARLIAAGGEVTLAFTTVREPGRWRLSFGAGRSRRPSALVLTVPESDAPSLDLTAAASPADGAPRLTAIICAAAGADPADVLASVRAQALPPGFVETLIVPATPDDATRLQALAASDPDVEIVDAPPAGRSPGAVGLERARGAYVVFLDVDDRLQPHALEKLVDAADATGADVAMGRVLPIHHRVKTPHAYKTTVLDADAVRERLLDTQTPHQLFRRTHLEEHGLHPAEDVPTGGRLFAAEAVLAAARVATLGDQVYCERLGAGTTLVTTTDGTRGGPLEAALRLAAAIIEHVPSGPRRDALLRWPADALAAAVLDAGPSAAEHRGQILADARARFLPWWTAAVRARLDERTALVLDVFAHRNPDAIDALATTTGGDPRALRARVSPAGIVYDLPASIEDAIHVEQRRVSFRAIGHMMTSLTVQDGVAHLTGWIGAPGLLPTPDGVQARLRLRGGDAVLDLPVTLDGPVVSEQPAGAIPFGFRIDPATLPAPGRWDLDVAPVWGEHSLPAARFGSRRTTSIDEPSVDITSRAVGSATTILYGTVTYENLSVAHDDGPKSIELTAARLGLDADGRPEVVVSVPAQDAGFRIHAEVQPEGPREARHRLPWRSLDKRHVAARLPAPRDGSIRCDLSAVYRGIIAPVRLPDALAPVSSGTLTAQVVHGAVVVSRREGAAA